MEIFEPSPFNASSDTCLQPQRENIKKSRSKMPIEEWRKRLAMDPNNIINHSLDNTSQTCISLESDSHHLPRRHHKSRFTFFQYPRVKDTFQTDALYPSVRSAQNYTCAQMFTGEHTGHYEVHPTHEESYSLRSLQDDVLNIVIPPILKRDNARTRIGEKQTAFEFQFYINDMMTEPKSPWQNKAEHSINDLGTMVQRNVREFSVHLNQCYWRVKCCAGAHNVLAMIKLG